MQGSRSGLVSVMVRVEKALGDRTISVDPAVAEERPVSTGLFLKPRVALDDENFLRVAPGAGKHATERVGDERTAPELDSALGRPFVADPVDRRDVNPVGDRVGTLHGLPCVGLGRAELGLLGGMPADGGRIKQDLGPCKAVSRAASGYHWSQQTSVPTFAILRVESLEPEIAGSEVVFLVIERVVRNVHLAIKTEHRAVGIEDDRRVVVDACRPALEDRADDDHVRLARDAASASVVGPGIGSARSNRDGVFHLAEIRRAKELGEAGDVRPILRGLTE